jgi:hypothetical protein
MIKGSSKTFILIVSAVAAFVALLFLSTHYIEKGSEVKFSLLLANLKEDMSFFEVEKILGGKTERTLTEQHDVEEWGTIKDSRITQECNLHMFLRTDVIPHRFILVYEDKKTHIVRRITWKNT